MSTEAFQYDNGIISFDYNPGSTDIPYTNLRILNPDRVSFGDMGVLWDIGPKSSTNYVGLKDGVDYLTTVYPQDALEIVIRYLDNIDDDSDFEIISMRFGNPDTDEIADNIAYKTYSLLGFSVFDPTTDEMFFVNQNHANDMQYNYSLWNDIKPLYYGNTN